MRKSSNFKLGQPGSIQAKQSTLFVLVLVALLLIVGALYWFIIRDPSASVDQNANDPTIESAKTTQEKSTKQTSVTDSATTTSEEVPVNRETLVTITNTSQTAGRVNASATVSGAGGQGTCVFQFTAPEAKPVTKEVTSTGAGEQTCNVSIPEVEFDLLGKWNLSVTFFRDNTKASTNTEVTIQ